MNTEGPTLQERLEDGVETGSFVGQLSQLCNNDEARDMEEQEQGERRDMIRDGGMGCTCTKE